MSVEPQDDGMKNKVVVVGIDGAALNIMMPWMNAGKLPNLARIIKDGAWGDMESPPPINSAPAWTSIVTGNNPGKHGVYGFKDTSYRSVEEFSNASSVKTKQLWTLLSEYGKKVGVINVPLTYPPIPVNGYMISGMDTPGPHCVFTYPPKLQDEINRTAGGYIIEANISDSYMLSNDNERKLFIKQVMEALDKRIQTFQYLNEKYPADFTMIVFVATDRIQHRFWKFFDSEHPHFEQDKSEKFGMAVLDVYQKIDEFLGNLLNMLSEDTYLMIVSDHGFGPRNEKCIYLNRWLYVKNFLQYTFTKQQSAQGLIKQTLLQGQSVTLELLRKILPIRIRHGLRDMFPFLKSKMVRDSLFASIDWELTSAYADELMGTIRINLKGREPQGIVEPGSEYEHICNQIIHELYRLKDPQTELPIVEKVYKREDLFRGDYVHAAPDLIIKWKDDLYSPLPSLYAKTKKPEDFFGIIEPEDTSEARMYHTSGDHRQDGIVLIKGIGIKGNYHLQGTRLIDIAPTVLHIMGLPVPSEMDGRVLVEALTEEFLQRHPVDDKKSGGSLKDFQKGTYSEEESELIRERLRSLGYVE